MKYVILILSLTSLMLGADATSVKDLKATASTPVPPVVVNTTAAQREEVFQLIIKRNIYQAQFQVEIAKVEAVSSNKQSVDILQKQINDKLTPLTKLCDDAKMKLNNETLQCEIVKVEEPVKPTPSK